MAEWRRVKDQAIQDLEHVRDGTEGPGALTHGSETEADTIPSEDGTTHAGDFDFF